MTFDGFFQIFGAGMILSLAGIATLELAVSAFLRTGSLTTLTANLRALGMTWTVVRGPYPSKLNLGTILHSTAVYTVLTLASWLGILYQGLMLARAFGARTAPDSREALRFLSGEANVPAAKAVTLLPVAYAMEFRFYDDTLEPYFAVLAERVRQESETALDAILASAGNQTFDVLGPIDDLGDVPEDNLLVQVAAATLARCNPLNAWEVHVFDDALRVAAEGHSLVPLLECAFRVLMGRAFHEGVSIDWFLTQPTNGHVAQLAIRLAELSGLPKDRLLSKFQFDADPTVTVVQLLVAFLNHSPPVPVPPARTRMAKAA